MFIYQDEPFYLQSGRASSTEINYKKGKSARASTSSDRTVKRSRPKTKGVNLKNKIFLKSLGLKVVVASRKKKNVK